MKTNNNNILSSNNGASHVVDTPLTNSIMRTAAPDLLVSEVDRKVVTIRPMSTPIDQISRMVGARRSSSMEVEYYSVDTRPGATTVKAAPDPGDNDDENLTPDGRTTFILPTANDRIFSPTETVMLPGVEIEGCPLMLYVTEIVQGQGGGLRVVMINPNDADPGTIPDITKGDEVIRMGRAAAELDVQTAQFEALPVKERNYCQIFKTQVEQSVLTRLSAKEVGWTFSDQEEVAIMDMRMGMEKSFLFGVMGRFTDPMKADEVMCTKGIWNQTDHTVQLTLSTLTQQNLIELMRKSFTGEAAGSTRKILVGGSKLIEAINKLDFSKVVLSGDTVTRWGIDFNELRSKFGTLYVIHSEVFDQCGHWTDGMIIDPEYLTKYVHVPFKVEHLDLKKAGTRNTDALVATEASCLVLRHPKTHVKVLGR